jgi:xanthine dehydrogenase large subunit
VYGDGSVSVSHGAIEMGQEVNTKIGQIVAAELGIPLSRVRVEGHSTRRTANASPTAASSGCDLNGHAAEDAARQIATRLKGLAARLLADAARGLPACADTIRLGDDGAWDLRDPDRRIPFPELVAKAVLNRVDLGAHGFYATPGVEFNRDEGRGNPFLYFVFGAAVSEVTVDLLTGRTRVDGAWIVHDSGRSLNVAVDLGQIHGAYVQCLGWVTTEELVYDAGGRLLSDSPTTYKIPSYGDAPALLQVELADNPRNEPGLKRSKANGEPPFLYGESVFFAIEDALASLGAAPDLAIPATPERVLQAADQARRVAASVPQTAAAPTRGARCIPTTPSTGTR